MADNFWGGQEDRRNRSGYRGNSRKENERKRLIQDLYGKDMAGLEMEAHQRPPAHISDILGKIMADAKMDDRLQFSDLLKRWEELVGTALSTLCRPVAIDGKTLMIEVNHASAMHVLETYQKPQVLKKVQSVCSGISFIRFVPAGGKI